MDKNLRAMLESYLSFIESETRSTLTLLKNYFDQKGSSFNAQFEKSFLNLANSRIARTYGEFQNFMAIEQSSQSKHPNATQTKSRSSFSAFASETSSSSAEIENDDSYLTGFTIKTEIPDSDDELHQNIVPKIPIANRVENCELSYEMIPGFRFDTILLYSKDELQFYVRNSRSRFGIIYACFHDSCLARVRVLNGKCFVANSVRHMHENKIEMYRNLCALNEMKSVYRSDSNQLTAKEVFNKVMKKHAKCTLLFDAIERSLPIPRLRRLMNREQTQSTITGNHIKSSKRSRMVLPNDDDSGSEPDKPNIKIERIEEATEFSNF